MPTTSPQLCVCACQNASTFVHAVFKINCHKRQFQEILITKRKKKTYKSQFPSMKYGLSALMHVLQFELTSMVFLFVSIVHSMVTAVIVLF